MILFVPNQSRALILAHNLNPPLLQGIYSECRQVRRNLTEGCCLQPACHISKEIQKVPPCTVQDLDPCICLHANCSELFQSKFHFKLNFQIPALKHLRQTGRVWQLTGPDDAQWTMRIPQNWYISQAGATWIISIVFQIILQRHVGSCFRHTRSCVCKELEWQSLCSIGPMRNIKWFTSTKRSRKFSSDIHTQHF